MTKRISEQHARGTPNQGVSHPATLVAVVCLCACFVAAAIVNAWTTSATYDETSHLPSGYAALAWSDYRLNPEHPPLIKMWAALPLLFAPVHPSSPQTLEDAAREMVSSPATTHDVEASGTPGLDSNRNAGASTKGDSSGGAWKSTTATFGVAGEAWATALMDNDAQWLFGHAFLYGVKDDVLRRAGVTDPFEVPTTLRLGRADFVNDADSLLFRARLSIVILGAALAVLVFVWSRRLFGLAGGILSLALFCFDPNFIAHSALVTTDVGVALFMTGAVYLGWRASERSAWTHALLAAGFFGLAIASKFSALILLPIAIVIGLIEIVLGGGSQASIASENPIPAGRRGREGGRGDHSRAGAVAVPAGSQTASASPGHARAQDSPMQDLPGRTSSRALMRDRALGFVGVFALSLAAAYLILWAAYGFRYSAASGTAQAARAETAVAGPAAATALPGRDPGHFPLEWILRRSAAIRTLLGEYPDAMPEEAIQNATSRVPLGPTARLMTFAARLHLLPEAYLYGFAVADMKNIFRGSYLLGSHSNHGWWYYFPVAFVLKTPVPALAAIVLAIVLVLRGRGPSRRALVFLLVPVLLYLAISMRSDLNIGHRHLLAIYPFLYVLCGSLAEPWGRLTPRPRRLSAWIALAAIVLGSFVVFAPPWRPAAVLPNDLAYFNEIAGGPRNGSALLVDSNLDWGQGLRALKGWLSRRGIEEPVRLCYFGTADPRYYGIAHVNLPGGYMFAPQVPFEQARGPGYIAVSATNLRGAYYSPQMRYELAEYLKGARLVDTAGYSIFIYRRD